ncbi:hypothetical protein AY599_23680 [Leptolyngbya valderiana BDU 20041]|nr:hypothetical protein AY599_23680 [Leptolyngbya valderiana BDU 20041]
MIRLLLVLSLFWSVSIGARDRLVIEQLEWLSGCWDGQSETASSEECWSDAVGGLMLGYGRVVRSEGRAGFEFLRIIQSEDSIVFIAQPGGGEATDFPAVVIEEGFARFANPAHDYPRVIEYRREGDHLTASIGEGETIEASESVNRFHFVLRDD